MSPIEAEPVAIASALQFPEGPLIMPDGSIAFVEVRRGASPSPTDPLNH